MHEQLIVVGVDDGVESLAALRWALKEAVAIEAKVQVVHCYLADPLTRSGFGTPAELHTASTVMLQRQVALALEEMPRRPEVECSSLSGRPADVLVGRSKEASLLVLGVHGQTALHDLILGRVASTCLQSAHCPVVIVDLHQRADRHQALSAPAPN